MNTDKDKDQIQLLTEEVRLMLGRFNKTFQGARELFKCIRIMNREGWGYVRNLWDCGLFILKQQFSGDIAQ